MSENVHITGVDFNSSKLPEWANEITQSQILDTLQKHFKTNNKKQDALKKAVHEFSRSNKKAIEGSDSRRSQESKSFEKLLTTLTKTSDKKVDTIVSELKNLGSLSETKNTKPKVIKSPKDKSLTDSLGNDFQSFFNEMSPAKYLPKNGLLSKFNTSITTATKGLSKLELGMIGVLSTLVGAVAGSVKNHIDANLAVYESGVLLSSYIDGTVVGAVGSLAAGAKAAKLSLAEMSDLTTRYGSVIEQVGIVKFGEMSHLFYKDMVRFGVTASESSEYLADYLDRQRKLSVISEIDMVKSRAAAQEQLKTTIGFSQALNLSRKDIEEQRKKQAEDVSLQTVMGGVADHMKASVGAGFSDLGALFGTTAPELVQAITNMAQLGDGAELANSTIQDLRKSGLHGLADAMVETKKQIMSGAGFNEKLIINATKNLTTDQKELLAKLTGLNKPYASSINGLVMAVDQTIKRMKVQSKEEKEREAAASKMAEARAKFTTTMSAFGNIWDNLIGRIFGSEKVFAAFEQVAASMSTWLEENQEELQEFGMTLAKKVLPAIKDFAKWISSLFKTDDKGEVSFDLSGMLLTGIGNALTSLPVLMYAGFKVLTSSLGGTMSSTIGKLFTPSGLGIGKGILKKFLSRIPLVGSLLYGSGEFFKSLGNESDDIVMTVLKTLRGFADGIIHAPFEIIGMISDKLFGTDIQGFLDENPSLTQLMGDGISKWVSDLVSNMIGGWNLLTSDIGSWISTLWSNMKGGFSLLIDDLSSAIKSAWEGLINGITGIFSDNKTPEEKSQERFNELQSMQAYDKSSMWGFGERSKEEEIEFAKLSAAREVKQPNTRLVTQSDAAAQIKEAAKQHSSPAPTPASPLSTQGSNPEINTHIITLLAQLVTQTAEQIKLQKAIQSNTKGGIFD